MATARIYVEKSSPSSAFAIEADWVRQNWGENYSVLGIWVINRVGPQGSTASYQGGVGYQNVHANGYVGEHRGDPFMPGGYGQNATRWVDYFEKVFYHDGEGWGPSVELGMELGYGGVNDRYDNGRAHRGSIGAPGRIPKPPTAPRNLTVETAQLSPTGAGVSYSSPADFRGAEWRGYTADWYEIDNVSNPRIWQDLNSNGYTSPNGGVGPTLKPGTTYHVYIYSRSNVGDGASAGIALTTLPSSPPGVKVQPSVSGQSATVTFSPPGGVSNVSSYALDYGRTDETTYQTVTSTSITKVIDGLTPGVAYRYRASALIGTYRSPISDWVVSMQPSPNTNPGNYYDGGSATGADVTYSWVGAANQSRSRATGRTPKGWRRFSESAGSSGGTGVVQQVTGGLGANGGQQAALVVFFSDATAAGFRGGQRIVSGAVTGVDPGSFYVGSVAVKPSRSQRMYGNILWLRETSPGTFAAAGVSAGSEQVVAANSEVELIAGGTAPSTATHAVMEWRDVSGTGWSLFRGGDRILQDKAQVTLAEKFPFFTGDTPDTAEFVYSWEGTPNESVSRRTRNTTVVVDPLLDPDCAQPPRPPRLPVIESACIDEVGVWRRYWLIVPASSVPQWAAVVPTITLETDAFAERQVRVRYYPNPLGLDPTVIESDSFIAEQIVSYVPSGTVMTLDGVASKAWAEVRGGDARPANHLLYGSAGEPPTWPALTCGYAFAISLDVPLDAPAGNLRTSVALTARA